MCVSDHCLVFSIDIDSGKKFEIIKKFKKDLMLTVKNPTGIAAFRMVYPEKKLPIYQSYMKYERFIGACLTPAAHKFTYWFCRRSPSVHKCYEANRIISTLLVKLSRQCFTSESNLERVDERETFPLVTCS